MTVVAVSAPSGPDVLVRPRDRKANARPRLGADASINYRKEDFVAATKAATGGNGADVILDMAGGDCIGRNYEGQRRCN
jgi:NADPH:quinone reductase-like Zn-dependent oxidoreductase